MLLGVGVLWLWGHVNNMSNHRDRREADVNIAKEKASEVDRINEDIAFYKAREKAIIDIKSNRILWAPKMDQIVKRTPIGVWLTTIFMKTLDASEYKWTAGKSQTGGRLNLTCYAQGTEVTALTNYRKALLGQKNLYRNLIDLSASPTNLFGDFDSFAKPSWERVELEQFEPKDNLKFELELRLKARFAKPVDTGKKRRR